MQAEIFYLSITAMSISCLHTATGPDHYIPFIALSKARKWAVNKTIIITILCGLGHVLGSVILGFIGIILGWSLSVVGLLNTVRGSFAGWLMFLAGLFYTLYAILKIKNNSSHRHFDIDGNEIYVYNHRDGEFVSPSDKKILTPWILFSIFVLGPCEPLIPLLSFPAAKQSVANIVIVICVFTLFTLITMLIMVLLGFYGISFFKAFKLEKYAPALAGITVVICGVGMLFMNW
jgi:sulfite exporter TauE/SafE